MNEATNARQTLAGFLTDILLWLLSLELIDTDVFNICLTWYFAIIKMYVFVAIRTNDDMDINIVEISVNASDEMVAIINMIKNIPDITTVDMVVMKGYFHVSVTYL